MDAHRVRRLAEVLVASQLRSGRSTSDPRSVFGRGFILFAADVGAFLFASVAVASFLAQAHLSGSALSLAATTAAPLVPLVAVAASVVAGLLFELTTTSRFAASDAVNWMPITPTEYVAASSTAIAYSYSPAVALFLGGLLPLSLDAGLLPLYLLTAVLALVALFEGAVLVEMVRAATQRSGSGTASRRGSLGILARAALLVLLVLALDLAFNPVFLLRFVTQFSPLGILTVAVPLLWSAEALSEWVRGQAALAVAFAVGQVAFVALLVWLAGVLRQRYWVAGWTEAEPTVPLAPSGHPVLVALGLSPVEAAIAGKDLKGFVRRREMLPTLVVPVVLVVLLVIEGGAFGPFVSVLWMGWVAGFFALLLSATAVGQERRSLQWLYVLPIPPRSVLWAKLSSVLVPGSIGAAGMALVVAVLNRFSIAQTVGLVSLFLIAAVVLALWGLVFAARYSDFQERPRPQYLRPSAMIAAVASGMVLLFAMLVPGATALTAPSVAAYAVILEVLTVALASGALAFHWAATGFERLFRELPY